MQIVWLSYFITSDALFFVLEGRLSVNTHVFDVLNSFICVLLPIQSFEQSLFVIIKFPIFLKCQVITGKQTFVLRYAMLNIFLEVLQFFFCFLFFFLLIISLGVKTEVVTTVI